MLRLLIRLGLWAAKREAENEAQRYERMFPPGCRVIFAGCRCSGKFHGQQGVVEGLCASGPPDYRVWPDGHTFMGKPTFELVCDKGMERIRP